MVSGQRDKRECWRCGAGSFTAAHLKVCKAHETHCNYCGIKGLYESSCNFKQKDKLKKIAIPKNFDRKLQNAKEYIEWIITKTIKIQRVTKWYSMSKAKELKTPLRKTWKGGLFGFRFKTMIDTGSPVVIFAVVEIKSIMRRKDLQVIRMVEGEKYVDLNDKALNLLGYVFCQLQVGEKFINKARILVAREGTKSIVGTEWLSTVKFVIIQNPVGESEFNVIEKQRHL